MSSDADTPVFALTLPAGCTVQGLAERLGGRVLVGGNEARGAGPIPVATVAAAEFADVGSLTVVFRGAAIAQLRSPSAVLVEPQLAGRVTDRVCWVHDNGRWALAQLLERFVVPTRLDLSERIGQGVFRGANSTLEPGCEIADDVRIGAGAVILSGAQLGAGTIVEPRAVIYGCCRIGRRVHIGAGAVIGRAGFGWVTSPQGALVRMPQLGGVIVEDDVEVGALATVDAGTLAPTRLRSGCKLDAHVHVGHNVVIGRATMVAAQAGFAGSASVGDGVLVGGQAGVADHVHVGDRARVAGGAGVIGNVRASRTVAGYPAVERMRWLRAMARLMERK